MMATRRAARTRNYLEATTLLLFSLFYPATVENRDAKGRARVFLFHFPPFFLLCFFCLVLLLLPLPGMNQLPYLGQERVELCVLKLHVK